MERITHAMITDTFLGREDHGIFTFYIGLQADSYYISFGGYELDEYDGRSRKRVFTNKGLKAISDVLEVVGVDNWEKLKGRQIKVVDRGWRYGIDEIISLDGTKRFNIREFFKEGE